MTRRVRLGINVDHVATLRQSRGTRYPDPVQAAMLAEEAGADGITVHPREDRRHIQDRDVLLLKDMLTVPLNLEMAVTEDMVTFAERVRPSWACFVPEKREELTTEGGLDVLGAELSIAQACQRLANVGTRVSLFIDPVGEQISAALRCRAAAVELHTGHYAEAASHEDEESAYERIANAAAFAHSQGLIVNAGHGLHYHNTERIAALPAMNELNIGHAIIARAVFTGLRDAVIDMRRVLDDAVLYGRR
ncbi:pyridoxine 5'-phosphate synthase [Tamilnaduibacter salinus]|uniref:Pyridoxine 5'-phosphate synthase n=1 Tax=Tamilnaduibacter salinus TaxID=1484056 RepID=A0A2A2I7T3_9GAMM|nr:pyridoxine 5'-phosphate synthase [Tamilnaduibacter salinus]PAV27180.1 pyridoxine 5'-phosphate synthase [Tamilnaduibacter salinus]PVY78986.1 pyridoxine 5'-phosphate synthase [Tamilnaduibacter salinus]